MSKTKAAPLRMHSGHQRCHVQDVAIHIQSSYQGHRSRKELREKGPPKILQVLKDVVLLDDSTAKLECRVSTFPDPFMVWFKDDEELKDGPKYRYVFKDPDVVALVVQNEVLGDQGKYTVTIKNTFGNITGSASILVKGVCCKCGFQLVLMTLITPDIKKDTYYVTYRLIPIIKRIVRPKIIFGYQSTYTELFLKVHTAPKKLKETTAPFSFYSKKVEKEGFE